MWLAMYAAPSAARDLLIWYGLSSEIQFANIFAHLIQAATRTWLWLDQRFLKPFLQLALLLLLHAVGSQANGDMELIEPYVSLQSLSSDGMARLPRQTHLSPIEIESSSISPTHASPTVRIPFRGAPLRVNVGGLTNNPTRITSRLL
jgi:hypothetical protein